jgi:hypothetical protein
MLCQVAKTGKRLSRNPEEANRKSFICMALHKLLSSLAPDGIRFATEENRAMLDSYAILPCGLMLRQYLAMTTQVCAALDRLLDGRSYGHCEGAVAIRSGN